MAVLEAQIKRSSGGYGGKGADAQINTIGSCCFGFRGRITSDGTNSLVIIATQTDSLHQAGHRQADIRRKQVFIEAVILELASDESQEFGLGAHLGKPNEAGSLSIFFDSAQWLISWSQCRPLVGIAMGSSVNLSVYPSQMVQVVRPILQSQRLGCAQCTSIKLSGQYFIHSEHHDNGQ